MTSDVDEPQDGNAPGALAHARERASHVNDLSVARVHQQHGSDRERSGPGFPDIERSTLFRQTVRRFLGEHSFEIITRPACFFVRLEREGKNCVRRVILLPPRGYTADRPNLLSPHPEVRRARVRILGNITPIAKGFKPLVRGVRFDHTFTRNVPTEAFSTYATFTERYCGEQVKSWGNWFYVAKENGWGYYHSLSNLTDEWVVMLLDKHLLDAKAIDLAPHLARMPAPEREQLRAMLVSVAQRGDAVLKDHALIAELLQFPHDILVPLLIQMLNVQETGKHENCTFFAVVLKVARTNRELVLKHVRQAAALDAAPHYYLSELETKLTV